MTKTIYEDMQYVLIWKIFNKSIINSNGCIEYKGSKSASGYGTIWLNEKNTMTHRVIYQCLVKNIPEGMKVLHTCDNKICCNPSHLFLGTNGDNNRDRHNKNRDACGERNGSAKLKEIEVIKIRKLINKKIYSYKEIAKIFNVTPENIGAIAIGHTWKHIKNLNE